MASQTQVLNSPPQSPDQPLQLEEENPPQSGACRPPKTLTLEIPDSEDQHDDDPNQDDPQNITAFSPTISDLNVSTVVTSATMTFSRCGGGPKRKKRRPAQEKKTQKKLEILSATLKPIPFVPIKTLDFASHEPLLKRLGLWDFVHLQFDVNLRADLIAELIAQYQPGSRCSYVNGVRINVNRPTLGRALKLPVPTLLKKDKGSVVDNAIDVMESEESIGFIVDFLENWVFLHDDMWMMSAEILNWTKVIKEGHFEQVDWAGMIWFMVEKELVAEPALGNCYYASHFQRLIKFQKEDLLKEEPVKMEVDVKELEEDDDDVKLHDVCHQVLELEEHNIKLTLGGLDNAVKSDGEKEENEHLDKDDAMDFEGIKEKEEEQGQCLKSSMDGHFLMPCIGEVRGMDCEDRKKEAQEGQEEGKALEEGEEEEDEQEEEMGFNLSPKGYMLESMNSENLISEVEGPHIPFSSGLQIHGHVSSGEFPASRVDEQGSPGGTSLFGNDNGNKREIGHLENDMPPQSLSDGNKRMRSDGPWDMRPSSDFDSCMDQVEHWMGKARMMYGAKEQAYEEMNMNQRVLLNELHERDTVIQHLHKSKYEEQQKRQIEILKFERELYMMGNLLQGYKNALKETHRTFAEYRAKFPLPEEPIYKDTGSGGLVLSTMELEKQRMKQEEEERIKTLLIEKKVKEFEAEYIVKFDGYRDEVQLLGNKLLAVEKAFNLLKEVLAKRKDSEMPECAPIED